MTTDYKLVLASSVGARDGMALELCATDGTRLAEVFRDDDTGRRTVTVFNDRALPLEAVRWLLMKAEEQL